MRRMLFVLSSAGLLGAALGCHCTQGVCDCDYTPWGTPIVPVNPGPAAAGVGGVAATAPGYPATAYPSVSPYAPAQAVPAILPGGTKVAEPIKEMPRPDTRPMGSGAKKPTSPEE
jgi:hypothetical protein